MPKEFFGEKYYTPQEIADMLGVTIQTIRKYLRNGLVYSKFLGKRYITEQSLKDYMNGKTNSQSNTTDK